MTLVTLFQVLLVVAAFVAAILGGGLTSKKLGLNLITVMQLGLIVCCIAFFFCLLGASMPGMLGCALLGAFAAGYLSDAVEAAKQKSRG